MLRRRYQNSQRRRHVAPIVIGLILVGGMAGGVVGSCMSYYPRVSLVEERARATTTATTATETAQNTPATTAQKTATAAGGPILRPTPLPSSEAPAATAAMPLPTVAPVEETVEETNLALEATLVPIEETELEATALPAEEAVVATPLPLEESVAEVASVPALGSTDMLARYRSAVNSAGLLPVPIIFVSRQIPPRGTVYWEQAKGMPGVGPFSRFELAAPGQLVVLEADGTPRILVDGTNPTAQSLNLIDVNAPDVSYDGQQIVFAGLPQGDYEPGYMTNPGAWRLYLINRDGSNLRQLTFSDQDDLDLSQFGSLAGVFARYDDTDPAWLPDGRIVFSSTRWPAFGQYGGARTTNLHVVAADGSQMHRITAERNSADRPLVDPVTGRIVYSRWWRNFRVPVNDMSTQNATSHEGYRQYIGLLSETDATKDDPIPGGTANVNRNSWHLGAINPDGTGLQLFTGNSGVFLSGEDRNHAYGGAFAPDGTLYANYFPMRNMTEASGFGGIRRYVRGPFRFEPIIGVTAEDAYPPISENPISFAVMQSAYAAEPAVLPDGRLLLSWAADINQDYGLYVTDANGGNLQKLIDLPGITELRARLLIERPLPPIIPDTVTTVASALPPTAAGPYDIDGTFTFNALNVYFNAPVDVDVISGIKVGEAGTIRFFMEQQREQPGSLDWVDWPILLQELPISPSGAVVAQLPANVPLFEQIRSPQPAYEVPLTGRGGEDTPGVAHVLGHNFGRAGEMGRCVGCHAGHTLIEVPTDPADAQWTNLAPGATVSASSSHPTQSGNLEGVVDRRVQKGRVTSYWRSDPAQGATGQWVQLSFGVPITVRTVRLYNGRQEAGSNSFVQVTGATVRLYSDEAATQEITQNSSGQLSVSGTDVPFADVLARAVRVEVTGVSGTFDGETVASLAEVEVIARAEAATTESLASSGALP